MSTASRLRNLAELSILTPAERSTLHNAADALELAERLVELVNNPALGVDDAFPLFNALALKL